MLHLQNAAARSIEEKIPERVESPKAVRKKTTILIVVESSLLCLVCFAAIWFVDSLFLAFTGTLAIMPAFGALRLLFSFISRRRNSLSRGAEESKREEALAREAAFGTLRDLLASLPPIGAGKDTRQDSLPEEVVVVSIVRSLIDEWRKLRGESLAASENRDKFRALLASTPRITELLHAHLAKTNGTTEEAALAIMGNLRGIKTEVEHLISAMEDTKRRVLFLHRDAQSKFEKTQLLLEGLNDYQKRLDEKIRTAIQEVIQQVNGLRSFTEVIHDVTSLTNILAINAAIEAARAGKIGRGFAVVASEVRKLSGQVESAANHIENQVALVSSMVSKELNAIADLVRGEGEARWVTDIAVELPNLSADFQSSVDELDGFVKNTHGAVQIVLDTVVGVMGDAQFQDITRQQIEQVQRGLRLLGGQLGQTGKYFEGDNSQPLDAGMLDGIYKSLESGYTMNEQRLVHQKVVDGRSANHEVVLPKIELF
jgi:methyl-accepting chemotaxis protein